MTGSNVVPISPARSMVSVSFDEMLRLADAIAQSKMFGMKDANQALVLMAIAQAEGRHPALAARDYDVIQGRPSKKSEAMLRDFIESGGKVEWHTLADTEAEATFSHPAGGTVRIRWDTDRLKMAGLFGKDMHKKYPRQMLRARVVSEGVRTVCPMATSGMYVPEEVADFGSRPTMRDVTPPADYDNAPSGAQEAAIRETRLREPPHADLVREALTKLPQPVAPPYDPVTGEVVPHALTINALDDGLFDWLGFGKQMIAAFASAGSISDLAEWEHLNIENINNMASESVKAHASVIRALGVNRERLSPPEPGMLDADETDDVLLGMRTGQ